MAKTWESRRLENLDKSLARFDVEMGEVASAAAAVVTRMGVGASMSQRVIPNTRESRQRVSDAIWEEVIRPYFIGTSDQPYSGERPRPQSQFAKLIFEGIGDAIQIVVDRQVSIVEKYTKRDRVVRDWFLNARRPVGELGPTVWYDPFHRFVYEKSTGENYVLSDAIWDTSTLTRETIDKLLAYYIADGSAAVDIAEVLENFLTEGERDVTTPKPYGTLGNYSARRLARTEITAAAGRAYVNAALVNPWIESTEWRLSGSHPRIDICDDLAGTYPTGELPPYPPHPHCLCSLVPVMVQNPMAVTAMLRADIDAAQQQFGLSDREARGIRRNVEREFFDILRVQGAFNNAWMKDALMYGDWIGKVMQTTSFIQ